MNKKSILFGMAIIVLFVIAIIGVIIAFSKSDSSNTTQRVDWIRQTNEIVSHDSNVSKLFNNNYTYVIGVVKNESFGEAYYSYGGKIYHLDINYANKSVVSIYEEQNATILDWIKSFNVTANFTTTS